VGGVFGEGRLSAKWGLERVDHYLKEVSGFRSCIAEFSSLLLCDAVSLDEWFPTFRSNIVLSSSELNSLVPWR